MDKKLFKKKSLIDNSQEKVKLNKKAASAAPEKKGCC